MRGRVRRFTSAHLAIFETRSADDRGVLVQPAPVSGAPSDARVSDLSNRHYRVKSTTSHADDANHARDCCNFGAEPPELDIENLTLTSLLPKS